MAKKKAGKPGQRRKVQKAAPAARTRGGEPESPAPGAQGLATLTVRLDPALLGGLRLAAVKRRIAGEEPWSQQGIVEEALREWLEGRGDEV